jgi:DNA invertase Pin-like site-specific DNA recombinase
LAAVRRGDALVVPKLDRLARSVTDARAIADELERCEVRLQLGTAVYDPSEPDGSHVFYSEARRGLATVAETLGSRSQRHRFSSSIG